MAADRPIQLSQHGTEGRLWAALLDVADATTTDHNALRDAPEPHWHALDAKLQPQARAAYRYLA